VGTHDFLAEQQRIMRDGRPSVGYDLLGMEIDFSVYLAGLDEIDGTTVGVRRTSRPACLIEASCRARPGVPLRTAAAAVQAAWTGRLRYREHEAHQLRVDDRRAVLDAGTQMRPGGLYVTARITVDPVDAPAG
jgi:hypothetical protein